MLAQTDGSGWQWLLPDAQGNIRLTANYAGTLAAQTYSPYGEPLHPALQSAYGYTGEPTDPTNGLVYLRARHLAPRLGVFISQDTYDCKLDQPDFNLYGYVGGNPVNRSDPSGLCWDTNASKFHKDQCTAAWVAYAESHDLSNPKIRELLNQEDAYWGGVSFELFTELWNDNEARPPLRYDGGAEAASGGLTLAAGVSIVNPAPGLEDILALAIAVGAVGVSLLLSAATSVALQNRTPYHFVANPPETLMLDGTTSASALIQSANDVVQEDEATDWSIPRWPEMKLWNCMTRCSVQGPTPPCGFQINGTGYGSTRDSACSSAKSDANSKFSLTNLFIKGCRVKHCTPCICVK